MKPAPFTYHAPASLTEALAILADHSPRAAVLAGGQSLGPLLNLRQRRPEVVVDIRLITEFPGIEESDAAVTIGASVTQAEVLSDKAVQTALPAMHSALSWVGHPATRSVGTICGSLAHGDPAAELPAVLTLFDGQVIVRNLERERTIGAAELYPGNGRSSLAPDEILVASVWPKHGPSDDSRSGWGFHEVARRHRDLPIALSAAYVQVDGAGVITSARVVLGGVGARPFQARSVGQALIGAPPTDTGIEAALATVLHDVEPADDVHASADYRRHLVRELARRAISDACENLRGVQR